MLKHGWLAPVLMTCLSCNGVLIVDDASTQGPDSSFATPCSPSHPFGRCPAGRVCDGTACVESSAEPPCSPATPRGTCAAAQSCRDGVCVDVEVSEICSPANPQGVCPGPSVCANGACALQDCGNAVIEPTEECDGQALGAATCASLGFSGGVLACDACRFDTSACSVCGDGFRDPSEQCDGEDIGFAACAELGDFTGGLPSCDVSCLLTTDTCTQCGDGIRAGSEQCDGSDLGALTCDQFLGYSGAGLACAGNCVVDLAACEFCGNGVRGGAEECDDDDLGSADCTTLGKDGGALRCGSQCAYDTSACRVCGDGVAMGPEWCDGADVRGITCESLRLVGGTLACDGACNGFDTSACGIARIEIRPGVTSVSTLVGQSATQTFEAWVVYNDGSEVEVTPQWYSTNGSAGSISAAGVFTSNTSLVASATTAIIAAWGGTTGLRSLSIDVLEVSEACGDGTRQDPEQCDQNDFGTASCGSLGFDGGALACTSVCSIDDSSCTRTSCPNGSIDTVEDCDCGGDSCTAAELDNQTCASLGRGFNGGSLGCLANCAFNVAACTSGPVDPLSGLTQLDLLFGELVGGATTCGNRVCEVGETVAGCASDCGTASCGNGTCAANESELVCSGQGGDCANVVHVVYGASGAPAIDLDVIGSFASGQEDVTSLVAWKLDDGTSSYDAGHGALNPVNGEFAPGGIAGRVTLTAAPDEAQLDCGAGDVCATFTIDVVVLAEFVGAPSPTDTDIVLPRPIPGNAASYFQTPCSTVVAASQPVVAYPHDGTLFPRNVYQVLFQWTAAGNGLFRASFDNDATQTHVSVVTTADRWRPTAAIWRLLTATNAGGSVEFSVDAVPYTGTQTPGACYQRAKYSVTVDFSRADVPGAIYYWSTSVGGIKKATISSPVPINFIYDDAGAGSNYTLSPTDPEWPYPGTTTPWRVSDGQTCVACHAVSRDGSQIALAYKGDDELANYDLTGDTAGVRGELDFNIVPDGTRKAYYWPTFSDGGDKIVATNKATGLLTLYAAMGGAKLGPSSGNVPIGTCLRPLCTSGADWAKATHADWSPDGRWLAFSYNAASSRDGDKFGALTVLRYNKEAYPGLPGSTDNAWGRAPWTSPLVLLSPATASTAAGGRSNWHHSTFSPDSKWIVVSRVAENTAPKDATTARLWALKWADCSLDASNQCVPYPTCSARGATDVLCGPSGDTACAACEPIELVQLNTKYSNCDNTLSGASPCESPATHQNNMPRWAPTNRPDAYFLVFTSQRPYGLVETSSTEDQLWVAGFDGSRSGDPSYPPFWLPFQVFAETNHRAYWSHDINAPPESCPPEICDGLDNDCDGLVDDGCCVPGVEVCNDEDDDCDGLVDERSTVSGPVEGAICCTQSDEVCDGLDNDCDDQVDEGCTGCTPGDEICDGKDNDCDGLVDQSDPTLTPNVGAPTDCPCDGPEVCDGLDNDCDGLVDDADPQISRTNGRTCCFPFSSDPCNGVDDDCDGVRDNGCCIPDTPPVEVCDNRDNDCDLLVDEADPDLGPGACCHDVDADSYTNCAGDCDDARADVNPGVEELNCSNLCGNGVDENCDGADCFCDG